MSDSLRTTTDATGRTRPETARAIAAGARPRRFGAWYVAEHRFRVMRSYLQTMLATGIGSPFIYLYGLGAGLASLVDAPVATHPGAEGVPYLVFVAPALLASAAITVATEEFSYPIMLGYKWNPTFSGMHAAPIRPPQIVDGIVISVTARILATSAVYYAFMLAFGAVPSPLGFLAVLAATLGGLAFGHLLMAYVSTLEQDTGQIALVMRFLVLPMTLFSGTFFPLTQLPWFLQPIGWVSPLWHATELSRVFSYGYEEPAWLTAVHVVVLTAMAVFGWVASRRIASRRLGR